MFKAGSIRKIQVENFVTYSHVELYPGPNLNMIIGPNGTGKSTIVAAIILGLGGSPKTLGRGIKISEYVKHGRELAKINIYLQDIRQNLFLKVTREFDRRDKSYWKLNDKAYTISDVHERISQFNIQVDNLCQFLPQDRVADFAKLNKKELLKETQIALCRNDLIEKQEALIETGSLHKNLLAQSGKHVQNLQEVQDVNSRLQGKVQNFNKKMKYKEKIMDIDRKITWTEYEEKRARLDEIKRDKAKAQEVCNKYRDEIKPIEKEINTFKKSLNETQQNNFKIAQHIRTHEGHINTTNEKIEALTSKVREIEDEMETQIAENDEIDKQIEETVKKLEDMKKNVVSAQTNTSDQEKQSLLQDIARCTSHIRQLEGQKEQVEQTHMEYSAEIRALENEKKKIENVKQTRLEQLRRYNNDAYVAVNWLRQNKHLFEGEVFEPIMLELNVLDNTKAKYVEMMIPTRDKLAFTCTHKNDMNTFIRTLREEQGLSINVLHSGPASERYNQPNIPIERLKKFGFYTYVNSLFTAPEPIMRYLCQTHRLHNIPVGNENTDNCYENLPKELNVFFSDRYRYGIKYSKYSGEKSIQQVLVKGDGGLSLSLDILRLENITGQCNDRRRKQENLQTQIEAYVDQINKVNEKANFNKGKLLEIQRQKQQVDILKNKIVTMQGHLNEMNKRKKSPDLIKKESKNKMKKLIETMGLLQELLKKYFKELSGFMVESSLCSVKTEVYRQKVEYMENQIADSKRQIREAEEVLSMVTDKYTVAIQEAKAQLQKAKGLSKGFTPADVEFNEFRESFDQLGDNIEELHAEKENLNSRIACLNTADDTEIQEYENQVKLIEKLKEDIDSVNSEINKVFVKMERLQKEWLKPLKDLVAAIDRRFASAFERMGCAGEVALCQGDNEKNYADYGISIKVTYRSGEPLQELNATVQSGGERAVATAAFMLALQELTPVPFRCVDEINQGMDANNERRIFELIVETTCQPDTSQYFLITPKLVPNLKYSKQLMVHIVHNGPFINSDQKWTFSKLCNPQSVQV